LYYKQYAYYLSGERQRKDPGPVPKNWLGRRVCYFSPFNWKIIKTTVQNNVMMQKKEHWRIIHWLFLYPLRNS